MCLAARDQEIAGLLLTMHSFCRNAGGVHGKKQSWKLP